jgi:hypothetical protein
MARKKGESQYYGICAYQRALLKEHNVHVVVEFHVCKKNIRKRLFGQHVEQDEVKLTRNLQKCLPIVHALS